MFKNKEVAWVDRGWYIVTEFEKTPSINFEKAVALAQTHPGWMPLMDERNILIYRNIYREQDLMQFQALYKLIKNWKGVQLYFKGDEVEYDAIASGIQCYTQAKLSRMERADPCETFAPDGSLSALGCIGCHRSGVSMAWNPGQPSDRPAWFFYGRLDQQRVYRLNTEDLRHAVIGHLVEYAACPLLQMEQIEAFLQRLPTRIDPRKDKEWVYNLAKHTAVMVRYHRNPDVLPVSAEAYRAYVKRVMNGAT